MKLLTAAAAIAVCALQIVAAQTADAQSLTWRFRNDHRNVVNYELYANARRHVWPGGGQVYTLTDSGAHQTKIACNVGEKVCYGAWVKNSRRKEWGAGYGGKGGCKQCCYTCDGGETPVLVIN
jgi:hypothetical protein